MKVREFEMLYCSGKLDYWHSALDYMYLKFVYGYIMECNSTNNKQNVQNFLFLHLFILFIMWCQLVNSMLISMWTQFGQTKSNASQE